MDRNKVAEAIRVSQGALGLSSVKRFDDHINWCEIELQNGDVFRAYQNGDGMSIAFMNPTRGITQSDPMDVLPGARFSQD